MDWQETLYLMRNGVLGHIFNYSYPLLSPKMSFFYFWACDIDFRKYD